MNSIGRRPDWNEYFLGIAKMSSTRSTCLSFPVGAVIVKDKQIISTGYNSPPSGSPHCTEQGYCYEGVKDCSSSPLPSRAIHAEANAIAQAAKRGIATEGATIYVTLEPCLTCLKLIIAAGIKKCYYGKPFKPDPVRDMFISEGLIELILLGEATDE